MTPKILFIEFTSHCNMSCAFCPSDVLKRKRGHIDDSGLRRFLDQIHRMEARPPILCNVLGEPLLNKKIYDYLDLFEKEGHLVTLITNTVLLMDETARKKLLKHDNLTIALSIQTVTKDAFKMRGCKSISLNDILKIPFHLIEEKFKTGSSTQIEIHIASNHALLNDLSISMDSPSNLWGNFPSPKAEDKWINKYIKKLNVFAKKIKKKFPAQFDMEQTIALQKYKEHIGTKVSISMDTLPDDFVRLTEEKYWGYMFLPDVLLRFKSFALWNRHYSFMKRAFPPDSFIYIEECTEPQRCIMTDHIGILANGDIIVCCLDYEGEMKLGNIKDSDVNELFYSERLEKIRKNAMIEPMCRRCKGNIFVFDTSKSNKAVQTVDKFGRGWFGYEKEMYGFGGRWTSGSADSYVYSRINAGSIQLKFLSEQDSLTPFTLEIHSFDNDAKEFKKEASFTFYGAKGKVMEYGAGFPFSIFAFYKIVLRCNTFVPDELTGNGDKRSLGIAVFDIKLVE